MIDFTNENVLNKNALDQLFFEARTHSYWLDKDISEAQMNQIYEITKMAPTSVNTEPARFIFIKSQSAKKKLRPALAEGNVEKTMSAPLTVIVASDYSFYEQLPTLFPHTDAKSWFVGNDDYIADTAYRNSTIQGAYLIMAARALGLDTGPMSGFENGAVDELFFAGTRIKSNFLINIGYGDHAKLHDRLPRLAFEDVARID